MVRRHRILDDELIYIVYACYRRFVETFVKYEENPETQYLFKFLWRVIEHRKGNPHYPEISQAMCYHLARRIEKEFNLSSYLNEVALPKKE
jgi:hypothetical protein